MAKRPRQKRLPTLEDTAIAPLEDAAQEYAGIRDERIGLSSSEHKLKTKVLALMKKHQKKTYVHDGIEIRVVAEEETVKVKVRKAKA
jgi:hypothetical protein